jgi:hypothetical protein
LRSVRRLSLALLLVASAVLAFSVERLAGISPAWRSIACAAAAEGVGDYVATGTDVILALAHHFQEWEALVPEALERSLRVFGERVPSVRRLLVADSEGRVIAAFDTGARLGAERRLLGALDPAAARLRSVKLHPAPYRQAAVEAGTVERLELAAPILATDGSLRGYVAGDLELRPLCERLSRMEAAGGALIGLFDIGGQVICPPNRIPPKSGARIVSPAGMVLVVHAPLWRRWLAPAGVVGFMLLLGLLLVAVRRPVRPT